MARKSDRVASMAARNVNLSADTVQACASSPEMARQLASEVRAMAASLLRQDEHKGLRGLVRKVLGK